MGDLFVFDMGGNDDERARRETEKSFSRDGV